MSTGALVRDSAREGPPGTPKPPDGHRRPRGARAVLAVALIGFSVWGLWVIGQPDVPRRVPRSAGGPPPRLETAVLEPDWNLAVSSIVAYDQWLRLNPDPALAGQLITSDHPLYGDAVASLRQLASGEWRYEPEPEAPVITGVRLLERPTATEALVEVRFASTPHYRVVDRGGDVIRDQQAGAAITLEWRLRYEGAHWLLAGTRVLGGAA